MKMLRWFALALMAVVLLVRLGLPAAAQTATPTTVTKEQLLDRWALALGGREKLASMRSAHVLLAMESGNLHGTVEIWEDSRGQHKTVAVLGAFRQATVFDGLSGWQRDQNGKVRSLGGAELEEEVTAAYFASNSQFFPDRWPGQVDFAGEDAQFYQLRIAPRGGKPVTVYLDKQTGLPAKEERAQQDRTATFSYSDWRDFGGIKFWSHGRQGTGDPRFDTVLVTEAVEWNPQLSADLFTKPAAAAAPDFQFFSGQSAGIPFELNSNHMYVEVRVNRSPPLWMIFDSGAEATVIDRARAQKLGLRMEGALETRGTGEESVETGLIHDVVIGLPGVTMTPRPIAAIPLEPLQPVEGRAVDGILGYDVISSFVVEIDYAARKIILHDPNRYQYRGNGEVVPFIFEGNLPKITGSIVLPLGEVLPAKLLVDTGARMALNLYSPFIAAHRILDKVPGTIDAAYGFGLGGQTRQRVGRLGALRIGAIALEKPVASFSMESKGGDANPDDAGLVGGEVLRRFRVIFDYGMQKMILEPVAAPHEPFEFDMSGAYLVAEGADFRTFRVSRVIANSPAAQVGLQVGDVIAAIDGKPAVQLTLEEVRRLFRLPDRQYRLELRRGAQVVNVRLKTRRLV